MKNKSRNQSVIKGTTRVLLGILLRALKVGKFLTFEPLKNYWAIFNTALMMQTLWNKKSHWIVAYYKNFVFDYILK